MLKIPAVVDLPTPPLPDATAIILSTPGIIGLLKGGPRTRPDALLENHCGLFGCHKPCQNNTIRLSHPQWMYWHFKRFLEQGARSHWTRNAQRFCTRLARLI